MASITKDDQKPLGKGGIGCLVVIVSVVALLMSLIPGIGPLLFFIVLGGGIWMAWHLNKERKAFEAGGIPHGPGQDPLESAKPSSARPQPLLGQPIRMDNIKPWNAKKHAIDLASQNADLREVISRHQIDDVVAMEESRAMLQQSIDEGQSNLRQLQGQIKTTQQELVSMRNKTDLQRVGLFDFEHVAESSAMMKSELERVRSDIKRLVREKEAVRANSTFTFNNSAPEGRKFVKQMSQVMLRAYNAEAENCVKTIRAGNLDTAIKRLQKAKDMIERNTTLIDLHIGFQYHRLRVKELELAAKHLQAVAADKESERARREELREQRKVEQEIARKKEGLTREIEKYRAALDALESGGDEAGSSRIRERLRLAEQEIEEVEAREANYRLGHVYVISNIGAFGEGVVKIGMTRRLDPMDRVRELGDASVPFRFDVHALFFTEDAVGVESMLHQHFAERRINRINGRKEFFRATPDEVLAVLTDQHVEVLEFKTTADAEEFRMSELAVRQTSAQANEGDQVP